jgi:hypothetical protein
MALVFEKPLGPWPLEPRAPDAKPLESSLSIAVVFTSVEGTLAALRKAGDLARNLNASIHVIVPQIVPYPLPLTSPPILLDFSERRFRIIAGEATVQTTVRIHLCRDRLDMLKAELPPGSIVVLGTRKTWWPNADRRLALKLRRTGHEVIVAED